MFRGEDPSIATFAAAAAALKDGRTSSRALVEACLARITDISGQGSKSFVQVYTEPARASAEAMDTLRRANRAPGPYAGIPISIKDLFDVAGDVTRAGSMVLASRAPAARHAVAVQRLLGAGLVLIGRTNMTEFAFSGVGINPHFGTPLSPWNRATGHIPGGSSSGAAVSVSDGFAFAGIGTDTGGSCRIPAALCGIVGFKPTARRVPQGGMLPLAPSLDSIGSLARSVACCAAVDSILAGAPREETLVSRGACGIRLVMPSNLAFADIDIETESALDRAVSRLDAAGVIIERRPLASFDALIEAQARTSIAAIEAYAWHRDLLAHEADRYDSRVASRIRPGGAVPAADYFELMRTRQTVIAAFDAEMLPYDALLLPTVPVKPPALADFAADENYKRLNYLLLRNAATINFLDGCAISLPCHSQGTPPAGLMLAAPGMNDERLLAVAAEIERVVIPGGPNVHPRPGDRPA